MDNELESYKKSIELDIAAIEKSDIDTQVKEHVINILNHSIVISDKKNTISDDLENLARRMTSANVSHCQGTLKTIAYTVKTIL